MISIIICSRTSNVAKELLFNIKSTIGFNYELIIVDNSESRHSISEAYNIGIRKSKGDFLCFLHDDIYIHTKEWGRIVSEIFTENDSIGLLGVAGSKYKTKMPSGWWNCPNKYKDINILQHLNGKIEKWYYGFENTNLSTVIAIDGVFMILRKENELFFNEQIKGYHNYDLNISLEIFIKGYKTVVTNQILIEHFSNGIINESWFNSTYKIHEIYKNILPISVGNNSLKSDLEFKNGFHFLKYLMQFKFQKAVFKLWFQLFLIKPFAISHITMFKILIKRIVKNDYI
jgi:glycosyltransferase involved in cell wall biosynthesis